MQETSRLIVKNIPKHLDEARLKSHFSKDGQYVVTDSKIMRKGTKSRQFAFVGFKTVEQAKQALRFFHNTYIDTSKVEVAFAQKQGDESIPRAWSRHTQGTTAYAVTHKNEPKNRRQEKQMDKAQIEEKKAKFRQFLQVVAPGANKGQSWNDSFAEFMEVGHKKEKVPKQNEDKEEGESKDK